MTTPISDHARKAAANLAHPHFAGEIQSAIDAAIAEHTARVPRDDAGNEFASRVFTALSVTGSLSVTFVEATADDRKAINVLISDLQDAQARIEELETSLKLTTEGSFGAVQALAADMAALRAEKDKRIEELEKKLAQADRGFSKLNEQVSGMLDGIEHEKLMGHCIPICIACAWEKLKGEG